MSVHGYVLQAGQGVIQQDPSLKASHESTAGGLTLIESHTHGGAPLHVHAREDECFYVLEGKITVTCGDQVFEAGPRSFVFLPRGIPHTWGVVGGTADVLILTVPGGFEKFMQAYHAAGQESNEVKDQIAARYGIQFIRKP